MEGLLFTWLGMPRFGTSSSLRAAAGARVASIPLQADAYRPDLKFGRLLRKQVMPTGQMAAIVEQSEMK
jgi:hypothetical protein